MNAVRYEAPRDGDVKLVTAATVSIREVRALPAQVTFRRIGGSGGWLGFCGEFRNPELGQVTMCATRTGHRVLLVTSGRSYIVTPGSPEEFVADLQARLRNREGPVPG